LKQKLQMRWQWGNSRVTEKDGNNS